MDEQTVTLRRYIVKARNLRYRIPGVHGGESFNPKVGSVIRLPPEIGEVEIKSGNVRVLLPDEQRTKKKKVVKKKVVKKKVVKKKK